MCFTAQSSTALKQGHQDKLLIRGRVETKTWMQAQRLKLITRSGSNIGSAHYSVPLTFCITALVFLGEQCHLKAMRCVSVTPLVDYGPRGQSFSTQDDANLFSTINGQHGSERSAKLTDLSGNLSGMYPFSWRTFVRET